jgi:hypothetical protein
MRTIIGVIAALLLAGCGEPIDQAYDAGVGMGGVYEVTLSDGTRCAVMAMPYKGGIDCNWEGK